ncbi:MAG: DNA polymerase Y family protein, partial [Luteimonas sp.]
MLWACIYLPHLGIDSVLRRHPTPELPLVTAGGTPERRQVVAVNTAAARAGLRPGQSLSAAHALLTNFTMVEHDEAAIARWQRFLAAWAYRYSSQVFADWPNCIVLEVAGSFGIRGAWPTFQAQLRDDLKALGFRHRIAMAPTPRAARILSRVQDGLAVDHPDRLQATLGRVPVRCAYLPEDIGDRLYSM